MNKKTLLSEEQYEGIMLTCTMEATSEFAKLHELSFAMEMILTLYSAHLTGKVHDRLFKEEVSK